MDNSIKPINLSKITTYSIMDRKSKVDIKNFAKPWKSGQNFSYFLDNLPSILGSQDLKSVISAITKAAQQKKQIFFSMGAHVIKVGLNPIITDLIRKKIITMISMNGAGIIHDLEIAMTGKTSEDVAASIGDGNFGMAEETSAFLSQAIKNASKKSKGLGRAVGEMINKEKLPFKNMSLFATCASFNIPATVHVAIGTDIIHMHPLFDAGCCGKASHLDFRIFASQITKLEKGVYINAGSAVILPEIFLKALTLARNLGFNLNNFTSVNLDFIRHYRPITNVVNRPTLKGGKGYNITGHHEILIPLIAAGVIEKIEQD